MTLDQRVAEAVHRVADGVVVPTVDLDMVRDRARARQNRRRAVSAAVALAVAAGVVVGAVLVAGRDTGPQAPVNPVQQPTSTATANDPDTTSWTTYTSRRYGFEIHHPPDWTVEPANRDWDQEVDPGDPMSVAHEAFAAPDGSVRVSAWNVPLGGRRIETIADIETWVDDYCAASGNTPCNGIADRSVELCLEIRDCHPALLVPFENDVQAFFSGFIHSAKAMTVVSVWRGESAPEVAEYGGAQLLLENFLESMDVWPDLQTRP